MNCSLKRLGCAIIISAFIAGCASSPVKMTPREQDKAPRVGNQTIQKLMQLPDPEVRNEAKSRGGNGPVYTVLGKSYRVMDSARGFRQEGIASWYGMKFHGRQTSNGERFDTYKLTAAHKHLPLPSYVRVTNLENGRKTIVRVNDRGPFHDNRIIDLSYAAAVKLGFHDKGTARVRVEVLAPQAPELKSFIVQAGAFSEFNRADQSKKTIDRLTGFKGTIVSSDGLYRVQLGPIAKGAALDRLQSVLLAADFGQPRLIPVR